jgi:hypothetical protein
MRENTPFTGCARIAMTQSCNSRIRAHLAEFGIVAGVGRNTAYPGLPDVTNSLSVALEQVCIIAGSTVDLEWLNR